MVEDQKQVNRRALTHVPRTRGAVSGLLIVLLGAWGALVPFFGPGINYGYTPDQSWKWTAARGWLEVLPGAVAVVGGLLLLLSDRRIRSSLGGWLAVAAGAWFVGGLTVAPLVNLDSVGSPLGSGERRRALETLGLFYAVGALLIFLGALSIGRLSVRSLRDVHAAQREIEQEREREQAERARVEESIRAEDERRQADDAARREAENERVRTEDQAPAGTYAAGGARSTGDPGDGTSAATTRLERGDDRPTTTFPAGSGPGTFPVAPPAAPGGTGGEPPRRDPGNLG
ncbi:MAG: hypothetical protein M3140_10100 [Actinomycetota bacterium]|nr:hypothetical protein [Actinomycetota bacterium]